MKNIRQITYRTVIDLFEEDRHFLVMIKKEDETPVMIFSENTLENGRTVINFVNCLQDNEVISYQIEKNSASEHLITIIVK